MHFAKEKRIEDEVAVLKSKQADLDEQKKMTLQNQDFCRKYIIAKDTELEQMKKQLKIYEEQIEQMQNHINQDREASVKQLLDYEAKKAELNSKSQFSKDFDRNKRISLKQQPNNKSVIFDDAILPDFKEAVDIAKARIEDRN